MLKEMIETGKTVDDAIESACLKLGCQREDCEWEIVDLPKKTFFGLKSNPAKVRVSVELPDPKPVKNDEPAEKKTARPTPSPKPQRQESAPKQQQSPSPKQQQSPPPAAPRQQPKPADKAPERKGSEKEYTPAEIEAKSALAGDYVRAILSAIGLEATVETAFEEGGLIVKIEGKGLGVMIGRRGETLDAVQYLTGLVVNRMEGSYMRVTIDCGDYRLKRQKTLESLAKRLSAQVLKTNVSKVLEPMNPFERRIIHATVSEIEGVHSTSLGEEPNRRVVISTPTSRKPSGRPEGRDGRRGERPPSREGDRDRRSSGGDRKDQGERRDRGDRRPGGGNGPARPPRPSNVVPDKPKATPETAVDTSPLYAKIDLE